MKYAQKIEAMVHEAFERGIDSGFQRAVDYFECVLHDPEVMGKDIFGRPRIDKIMHAVMLRDVKYAEAYTTKDHADEAQEHLDAELRQIYGDDLVKFYDRQPMIKHVKY